MKLRSLALAIGVVCIFLIPSHLLAAGNYFRVEQRAGVWWFVSPSGQPVISAGVDNVSHLGDAIRRTAVHPYSENISKLYPSEGAWAKTEISRLRSWGFNNLGAWTSPFLWSYKMPYTVILDIATHSRSRRDGGAFVDVFSPRFEDTARKIAEDQCAPHSQDPYLIGYFSDNELRWGAAWRHSKQSMLTTYLKMPSDAPGRQHAIEFLKKKYSDQVQQLNQAWGIHAAKFGDVPSEATTRAFQDDSSEFLGIVAQHYFEICAHAIHEADPNHLYLGAKFAGLPPDPVLLAAHAADVVSVDVYNFDPREIVQYIYQLSHRPVLVAEFAFRAQNSGLPNTRGAGPRVADQPARARAYKEFVTKLESLPEAVGYQWFEWCDEPRQGRFDGEDSNYGLVNIDDQPYLQFVTAVKTANREAISAHQKAGSSQ